MQIGSREHESCAATIECLNKRPRLWICGVTRLITKSSVVVAVAAEARQCLSVNFDNSANSPEVLSCATSCWNSGELQASVSVSSGWVSGGHSDETQESQHRQNFRSGNCVPTVVRNCW